MIVLLGYGTASYMSGLPLALRLSDGMASLANASRKCALDTQPPLLPPAQQLSNRGKRKTNSENHVGESVLQECR